MKTDQNVSRALQSLWLKEKSEGRCLSICNFFIFFLEKSKFIFKTMRRKQSLALTVKRTRAKVAQGGISPHVCKGWGSIWHRRRKVGALGPRFPPPSF